MVVILRESGAVKSVGMSGQLSITQSIHFLTPVLNIPNALNVRRIKMSNNVHQIVSLFFFSACWVCVLASPSPATWASFALTGTLFLGTCINGSKK